MKTATRAGAAVATVPVRVRRGEVWTAAGGVYARKPRPVVIVRDDAFDRAGSVTVCPMTTQPGPQAPHTRVQVNPTTANGLLQPSHIMVDKVTTLNAASVHTRLGRISADQMADVDQLLLIYLGIGAPPAAMWTHPTETRASHRGAREPRSFTMADDAALGHKPHPLTRTSHRLPPPATAETLLAMLLRRRHTPHRNHHNAAIQTDTTVILATGGFTLPEQERETARRWLAQARAQCPPEYWTRLRRRLHLPEQRPTGNQRVYPIGEDETYWRGFHHAIGLISQALTGTDYAHDHQMRLDSLFTSHQQELTADALLDVAGTAAYHVT